MIDGMSEICIDCVHQEVCRYECHSPSEHCNDRAVADDFIPQGEWIPKQLWDNTHIWVCSECGNQNTHGITVEKSCWKCGAKMKGGEEE